MLLSLVSLVLAQTASSPVKPLLGFTSSAVPSELSTEAEFAKNLDREEMKGWMKRLSAKPHAIGSPYQKENAEFILSLYKSWGYDAKIEEFPVLFPTPKMRLLQMVAPTRFTASLTEPAVAGDESSTITENQLPPYNAYSPDGDVTGELVYVNFGTPEDYEILDSLGISVKGKIVISRYGGAWRGIKPKVAAEHGAIGCIIFSDPRDDGYGAGDVYPKGGFRNEHGVQRGSIADMPLYPGDPAGLGLDATPNPRPALKDIPTLAKIPTLPISYADALPLLAAMEGPVAPAPWRGGLPITYHVGGGPAKVHLKVAFNWDLVTARDVVATLKGNEIPDEWIIRGNHYDAWVMGAEDPLSGQVAMLEEAKRIALLAKAGKPPKRTVKYCSWDGEEPGLLGSTAWVASHFTDLIGSAVAYINTDDSGRGFFGASGSPELQTLVNQVIRDVPDPETRFSVLGRFHAREAAQKGTLPTNKDFPLGAMGSGSDFSPFLQHAGVASLDFGFGGEGGGGSYHSLYDTYDYYTRFMDPKFDYERSLSEVSGRTVLRLANSEVLPFDFAPLVENVGTYTQELKTMVKTMRKQTAAMNAMLKNGVYAASLDASHPSLLPSAKAEVPDLDFAPLDKAVAALKAASKRLGSLQRFAIGGAARHLGLNGLLQGEVGAQSNGSGLPRRQWYRNAIYAPGFYTGYGVKTLPGVREAIEQRNWPEAAGQIKVVSATLMNVAARLNDISNYAVKFERAIKPSKKSKAGG